MGPAGARGLGAADRQRRRAAPGTRPIPAPGRSTASRRRPRPSTSPIVFHDHLAAPDDRVHRRHRRLRRRRHRRAGRLRERQRQRRRRHRRRRRPGRRPHQQREHVDAARRPEPADAELPVRVQPGPPSSTSATSTATTTRRPSGTSTRTGSATGWSSTTTAPGALSSPHSGAMGEAWSDWYALDLLHREGLEIDDLDTAGRGRHRRLLGRGLHLDPIQPGRLPAERDHPVLPGRDQHRDRRLHLRRLRQGLLRRPRSTPTARSGCRRSGTCAPSCCWRRAASRTRSDLSEALVTEAMRLSPPEPSFLDMRNSILVADQGVTGGDLQDLIWRVFAGRGMGFYASVADSSDVTPIEDFNVPPDPDAPTGDRQGTVTSADTGLPLEGITVGFGGHTHRPELPGARSPTPPTPTGTTRSRRRSGHYGELVFKGARRLRPGLGRGRSTSMPARPRPTTRDAPRLGRLEGRGDDRPAATTPAARSAAGWRR